ncbi:MAG: ATP-binding protein [Bacteroidota bacterium]|nr:ATP-binding protein [Bacteroidota bacterium]
MQQSILPFICSLLLTQRIISFSKINNHPQWVKWFSYVRYFSIFLIVISASGHARWIWHILLVSLLLFAFQQKEMRTLRMYLLAFTPFVVVSLLSDLIEIILKDFYNRWSNYFEFSSSLAVIWLLAILFSQYRQNKTAEKERIKRQQEDEINRAIAIRKVELEGLVAERTAELTRQKEELEHTLDELQATQTQLIQSEKMASLGELTAGIAHEIQNPLNFVNNFSEINTELISELEEEIKKENRDLKNEEDILKDLKENEQKINHHGKRAEAIVKGMLQHSRSSTGKKELTDINALADEYLRLAYHGLRAKDKSFNATMKTDFDETIGKINVIPQDIGRVILNLITNAFYAIAPPPPKGGIKNTPTVSNPTVWLSTKKEGDKVFILVRDNGPGIQKEVLDKIFQPFFTTKPAGQGTGLGLSMSYEIVTKGHGGELKVENNPEGGAKFTVVLPVLKK